MLDVWSLTGSVEDYRLLLGLVGMVLMERLGVWLLCDLFTEGCRFVNGIYSIVGPEGTSLAGDVQARYREE